MFNNIALDVTIGLVFVFLLYSLLMTVLQELIVKWFGIRQRFLVKIMRRMLEDAQQTGDTFTGFFKDMGNSILNYFRPFKKRSFTQAFYNYPAIKYLGRSNNNSKPSYISPQIFSQTLVEMLRGETYDNTTSQMLRIKDTLFGQSKPGFDINPETRKHLQQIWINANEDIDKFKAGLENWFNEVMDRATGWYKRLTQSMLLVLGLAVAIGFNIDAVAIGRILLKDKKVREQMVTMAETKYKAYGKMIDTLRITKNADGSIDTTPNVHTFPLNDTILSNMYKQLSTDANSAQLVLGLGRSCSEDTGIACRVAILQNLCNDLNTSTDAKKMQAAYDKATNALEQCSRKAIITLYQDGYYWIGWILTAFAISLGAPFWFDLLNKIMMLRTASKPADDKKDTTNSQTPVKRVG